MFFHRRKFLSLLAGASVSYFLPRSVCQAGDQLFNKIGATFVPLDHESVVRLAKIHFKNQDLPTAKACLVCQQPIENIGGQKLLHTKFRGTSLSDRFCPA